MNAGYKDYLEKGTFKILDLDSSLHINEEERNAIITAFANELANNIGDTAKLRDYDFLVYSTLLQITDKKLSCLISDSNVSDENLEAGKALCERLKTILKIFEDYNWAIPPIENNDPNKCAATIRTMQETRILHGRILEIDRRIEELKDKARKELSSQLCDEIIDLAKKLKADLDACKQKGYGSPQIKNGNIPELYSDIEEIRKITKQKEETYQSILNIDKRINAIIKTNAISIEEIQRLVALCSEQNSLFSECEKRHWPIPNVNYANPEALSMQYRHYGIMKTMDSTLSQQMESLATKKQYEAFYKNCDQQLENIITCIRNKWAIPGLINRDPEGLKTKVQKEQIAEEKRRKSWLKLTVAFFGIITLIIIGTVWFNDYRSKMAEVPFDSSYTSGKEVGEIYDELQDSGFVNIKKQPSDLGWLADNTVMSVTIDNSDVFFKGRLEKPDVNVVIEYSSPNRMYVTDLLRDWKTTKYTEIKNLLSDKGFTNVIVDSINTDKKDYDDLIAEIQLNDEIFSNEPCYIPKTARIKITYYNLQIGIGGDSSQFIGQDYRDVVASLEESGFTNVQTQEITTGWVEGNKVVGVTVNNVDTYDSSKTFEPDIKIVVKYSSDDRENVTDVLVDWQKSNYKVLQRKLREKGLTNVKIQSKQTETKSQNNLVSSVKLNNEEFIVGDCYLPKSASVLIEYYLLKIKIGNTAKEFMKDKQYSEVVRQLREKGFNNIRLMRANNILWGIMTKEGTINKITINGSEDFKASDMFRYDSEIVIVVNTKKGSGCEDITEVAP